MSRGIVGGRGDTPKVASPIYKQSFDLRTGQCLDDARVRLRTFEVRVRANQAGVPLEIDLGMALMFGASAVLCLTSTLVALRIGLKRIREIDA